MSLIKICGLMRREDVEAVNMFKPDYAGFVLAPSGRRIDFKTALSFRELLSGDIKSVGVFVNEDRDVVAEYIKEGIIDIIQLHGNEPEEEVLWYKENFGCPVIKAVSVKSPLDIMGCRNSLCDYLLLDNGSGGTGKAFDWSHIGGLKRPYFLAGGLNENNIHEALKLKPFGVDISGGVETDGRKDPEKIRQIIKMIREKE